MRILREDLSCPYCGEPHSDIDEWALKPHKTHLCLECNGLFEGSVKAVSLPQFFEIDPDGIQYQKVEAPTLENQGKCS
jgi:hypothetical protein